MVWRNMFPKVLILGNIVTDLEQSGHFSLIKRLSTLINNGIRNVNKIKLAVQVLRIGIHTTNVAHALRGGQLADRFHEYRHESSIHFTVLPGQVTILNYINRHIRMNFISLSGLIPKSFTQHSAKQK